VKQILATEKLQKPGIAYYSALIRNRDACETALEAVAAIFARGIPANLENVNSPSAHSLRPQVLVDLPSYPWNHTKRFWAESRLSSDYRFRPTARSDFIGAPASDWNPIEPRWRNFIRVSEQPWVKDHQVQGSIIYPAAGYISMALEAAKQVVAPSDRDKVLGYKITELVIARALVIPQTELGVEVIFAVRPFNSSSKSSSDIWKEFRVFSYSSTGPNEHCRGLMSVVYDHPTGEVDAGREFQQSVLRYDSDFKAASAFCKTTTTSTKVYDDLAKAGLGYGPTFRNLVGLVYGAGKAIGKLTVPDTKSIMPHEFEHEHLIHPATMDTFFQTLFPALTHAASSVKEPYMPTFIQELFVSKNISSTPGHQFEAVSEAAFVGFREAAATIVVRDAENTAPVVRIHGLKCTALTSSNSENDDHSREEVNKLCFDMRWEPDLTFLSKSETEAVLTATGIEDTPSEYIATLEMIAYYFFEQVLKTVAEDQVVQPHLQKYFRFMQHQHDRVIAGTNEHQTEKWLKFDDPVVKENIENLILEIEKTDYEGQFVCRMGRKLPAILRNEVDPLALMLEDELLYNYYAHSLGIATSYAHLSKYITLLSHKTPGLRYLEIGAGTGGATVPILQALGGGNGTYPRFKSYTYTDISSGFFEKAEEKFSDWNGLLDFRKLNIEQDPISQGFGEDEKFDVVIAFNVLHATHNMENTMANVRKLLKTGGKLLLLEITHVPNRIFLPFGNLPGWWMSEEPFRQWGPTMDEQTWASILKNNGFGDLQSSTTDHQNPRDQAGRLMIVEAINPGATLESAPVSVIIATSEEQIKHQTFNSELANKLLRGQVFVSVKSLSKLRAEDLAGKICICIAELERELLAEINSSDFDTLKLILQECTGLLWITEGACRDSNHPSVSLIHGLARTLRAEHEGFPLITFDFSPENPLPASQRVGLFLSVFDKVLSNYELADREYSEKNGLLYIKRCIENAELNGRIAGQTQAEATSRNPEPFKQPGRPLTLEIGTPGLLDTLIFRDDPTPAKLLAPDYVEINVQAVGLNFRDIMVCMGQLVDNFLGCECSGIVTKIGSEVTNLKVGDRVCTWTLGAYCNYVHNPAALVQQIPDDMTFTVAHHFPSSIVQPTMVLSTKQESAGEKPFSFMLQQAVWVKLPSCFAGSIVLRYSSQLGRRTRRSISWRRMVFLKIIYSRAAI